jgi:hypothetical protein
MPGQNDPNGAASKRRLSWIFLISRGIDLRRHATANIGMNFGTSSPDISWGSSMLNEKLTWRDAD